RKPPSSASSLISFCFTADKSVSKILFPSDNKCSCWLHPSSARLDIMRMRSFNWFSMGSRSGRFCVVSSLPREGPDDPRGNELDVLASIGASWEYLHLAPKGHLPF